MGHDITRLARENTQTKLGTRLVLMALADRANKETGECWPSLERIAEDAGVSRETAKRATQALVTAGEISVVREAAGRGHSRRYRIDVGMSGWKGGQIDPVCNTDKGGQIERERGSNLPQKGGQIDPRTSKRTGKGNRSPSRAQARVRAEWLKGELDKVTRMDLSLKATGWSPAQAIEEVPWIAEVGASFGMINGTIREQFEGFIEAAESKPSFGRKRRLKQTWGNSCRRWRDNLGAPQHEEPTTTARADGVLMVSPNANGVVMWGKKPTKLTAYVAGMVALLEADEPDLALVVDVSRCPKLAGGIRDWAPTVERVAITVVDGDAPAPQSTASPAEQPGMF